MGRAWPFRKKKGGFGEITPFRLSSARPNAFKAASFPRQKEEKKDSTRVSQKKKLTGGQLLLVPRRSHGAAHALLAFSTIAPSALLYFLSFFLESTTATYY